MIKKIQSWLENPKRDYASGLDLFNKLAHPEFKNKFGVFLNEATEEDKKPFSMKFNMLINKVTQISIRIRTNPQVYAELLASTSPLIEISNQVKAITSLAKSVGSLIARKEAMESKPENVQGFQTTIGTSKQALQSASSEKEQLAEKLQALEKSETPNAAEIEAMKKDIQEKDTLIESLNDEIADMEERLEELEGLEEDNEELSSMIEASAAEIEELKKQLQAKGLTIVTENDLPKGLQGNRARIREIVPLMAKIHGELSESSLTDDDRKKLAIELCDLDDERIKLWDEIDNHLLGKEQVIIDERNDELPEDPVLKGMMIAKRIDRLTENIRRGKETIEKSKKENIRAKAQMRVDEYQEQLNRLQAMLKGGE